jgi:D-arabinan exo alpha-(1,3)/(1,5)-arabinofuranosidase (non-reducing end)
MHDVLDLDAATIDPALDSRAVTFENPTGERGGGGITHGGRKGSPSRRLMPGDRVVLADLSGPGILRHIWMTFPPAPPEIMRGLWMEVFYDGAREPSVSVPCLDFFASPHGRAVAFDSALVSVHEGRGFNAYFPMPFRRHVRVQVTNASACPVVLYYQIDYTLEPVSDRRGLLHVSFRRENPTVLRRDFVISDGLKGPGRFLGCSVGVRIIDRGTWYGEGEVKVYRDGDHIHPTICGTGLEDYVGSAWGLGPHAALYAGAPLEVRSPTGVSNPDLVGFYRWHLPDPIMFTDELRVTIQQIGFAHFIAGQEREFERYAATNPAAGGGWERNPRPGILARGIAERVDDYCATAYVYCRDPQAVPRLDVAKVFADIGRRPHETPHPLEALLAGA